MATRKTAAAPKKTTTKATTKKATAMTPKVDPVAELRKKYATLATMNAELSEQMQKVYRFARDNALMYTPVKLQRDPTDRNNDYDDDDYEESSWDSSSC